MLYCSIEKRNQFICAYRIEAFHASVTDTHLYDAMAYREVTVALHDVINWIRCKICV